ncbi:MAG: ATP-binding cassette domain-containing protein [Evtepia gabavorous]
MIDIAVRDLKKEYEVGQPVLDGLTFQVDTGERVGILGRNGAGKTTLFRILTGQEEADSGEVILSPGKRLGLISQIPVYPAGYTVEDVLRTAFDDLKAWRPSSIRFQTSWAAGTRTCWPGMTGCRRPMRRGAAMRSRPGWRKSAPVWALSGPSGTKTLPISPGERKPGSTWPV